MRGMMRRGMCHQPLSFQLAPRHRISSSQYMHCRSVLKVAVSVIIIASMPMLHRIGRQDESRRRGGGAEQKYRQQRAATDRNCHRWRTRRGSSAAKRSHYLVLLRPPLCVTWLARSIVPRVLVSSLRLLGCSAGFIFRRPLRVQRSSPSVSQASGIQTT